MSEYKCKYAFDEEDEYCAKCDGTTITLDNNKVSATNCHGYEPSDIMIELNNIIDESPTNVQTINPDPDIKPDYSTLPFTAEDSDPIKIVYTSGIKFDYKGSTYNFECTEERIVRDINNIVSEREKLWATINSEVDNQMKDVMG